MKKKLKLKCGKLRALSTVYGKSLQKLVKMAEVSWLRSRNSFTGEYPTGDLDDLKPDEKPDTTVIDVSDEYTFDQWREIINTYVDREFSKLPSVLETQLAEERRNARLIRETLPAYEIQEAE
jgi:hypothetical protein